MKYFIADVEYDLTFEEASLTEKIRAVLDNRLSDRGELQRAINQILEVDRKKYVGSIQYQERAAAAIKRLDRRAELERLRCVKAAKWVKKYAKPGMIIKLKGTRDGRNRKIETVEAYQLICRKLRSPYEVTTHGTEKVLAYYDAALKKMVKI